MVVCHHQHEGGRLPSDSVIAKHGEEEMTRDEILIEKLQNVEYDGNEVEQEIVNGEESEEESFNENSSCDHGAVSEGLEKVAIENGHVNEGLAKNENRE